MIRIEKLNEDAQIAIMIIIAKRHFLISKKIPIQRNMSLKHRMRNILSKGVSVTFRLQTRHLKNAGSGLRQKTLLCWMTLRR